MPTPNRGEKRGDFMSRCMGSSEAQKDFPNPDQRFAFCNSQWERKQKSDLWTRLKDMFSSN